MADSALTTRQLSLNPVGLWVLDEAAGATVAVNRGSSGSGFNGSIGANVVMGVAGAISGTTAAQFSATGSTVSDVISTDAGVSLEPADAITLELVVNGSIISANDVALSYGDEYFGNGYQMYRAFANGQASWQAYFSGTGSPDTFQLVSGVGSHHLVSRFDGSNISTWIDGVKVASRSAVGSILYDSPSTTGLWIGSAYDSGGTVTSYNGTVQNVAVYPVSLSDSDILENAQASGLFGLGSPIVPRGVAIDVRASKAFDQFGLRPGEKIVIVNDPKSQRTKGYRAR